MTHQILINNVELELVRGNIANQPDIIAIVNAANAELRMGGGVAGAIHRAAGAGLEEECRKFAPIKPGEAVITSAHKLPNKYVIHCLGPVYGVDKPEEKLLADCYRNALKLADQHQIDSIAFPSISTGYFGYPTEEAAKIAFKTILDTIPELKYVKKIRFILYTEKDLAIHERIFSKLQKGEK